MLRYKDNDKHKDKPGEIVCRTNAQAAVALNEPDHQVGRREAAVTIHHDKTVHIRQREEGRHSRTGCATT